MKQLHGNILIITGSIHSIFGVLPISFGKQFSSFSKQYFFKISDGLSEFPLLSGKMNYENFAAFWFFYFGLLIIPLGILVKHLEKESKQIPFSFVLAYLTVALVGVYMIPFSGMTLFILPHALYMFITHSKYKADEK